MGWSLISAFRSSAITASTSGIEKLSTVLGLNLFNSKLMTLTPRGGLWTFSVILALCAALLSVWLSNCQWHEITPWYLLDSSWGRDIIWFNKIYSEVSNKFAGQPYSFLEIYPTYTFFIYPTTNSEGTNPELVLRKFTFTFVISEFVVGSYQQVFFRFQVVLSIFYAMKYVFRRFYLRQGH